MPRLRFWRIVAKRIVLAAGAHERSIALGGNDKPGVMLEASAMRTYINRFAVAPGTTIGIFTCSDDGWRTARDAAAAGIDIAAIIDARPDVAPEVKALAGNDTRVMLERGSRTSRADAACARAG